MKIKITLKCPNCSGTKIVKNGTKKYKKQNYLCKNCGSTFIGDHALTYKGCCSNITSKILLMLVRGLGIRDIAEIEKISIRKVLSVLVSSNKAIKHKQDYYDELEVDEFWSYVGNKRNKLWLVYAYHRKTGEVVAWVFGKRNLTTAKKLRARIRELGLTFGKIYTDDWAAFKRTFEKDFTCI